MKLLYALIVLLFICSCHDPNLDWEGEKTYDPFMDRIFVGGLGINDSVTILFPDSALTVAKLLENDGRASASGYFNSDDIIRMRFVAIAGSFGFTETTDTVFSQILSGPTLASGASDSVTFGIIDSLECGVYKQVMKADTTDVLTETNENDNQDEHYFLVPSTQTFGLSKNELVTGLPHDHGTTTTTTFTVTTTTDTAWITGFSFVATENSTAAVDVTLPLQVLPASTQDVNMMVTSIEHSVPGGFESSINGKLTVISNDGCVIKQESAKVFIEHQN